MNALDVPRGLEGVRVDHTAISCVDGQAGTLRIRGYSIAELFDRRLADAAWLTLAGEWPDAATAASLDARWQGHARRNPLPEATVLCAAEVAAGRLHPMAALQALLVLLPAPADDPAAAFDFCAGITGLVAGLAAATFGTAPAPATASPVAALLAAFGHPADAAACAAFERTQILQLEHGFNAGTFTARCVASTRASLPAALAAAAGALSGALHGGADEAAMAAARAVGDPAAAPAWVDQRLAAGDRVMGMGHREYKVVDPRAVLVRPVAEALAAGSPTLARQVATLAAIEARFRDVMAARNKALHANVDFWKGVVYAGCGIPDDWFTVLFAQARCFGWAAHVLEQRADNRLIRPAAHYVGVQERTLVGVHERTIHERTTG